MSSTARGGLRTLALALVVSAAGVALAAGLVAAVGGHAAWYAARASGLLAYVLATASVLFGLATATRTGNPKPGLGFVTDVHRALSLLTLLVIGGHVLFLALDSYAGFGPLDLLVPFASWYRPVWTGLGVLAAYLAVAVYASFYIRSLIGYRAWRAFHYASFGVFGLGSVHGVFAGTDSSALWASVVYAGAIAAVALMAAYRLLRGSGRVPAWAFEESSGNLGAARAVLATAVLFAALALPLWMVSRPVEGVSSPSQPAAAVDSGGFTVRDNGRETDEGSEAREREREQEREHEGEREGEGERERE
jgi:hypothetical protein